MGVRMVSRRTLRRASVRVPLVLVMTGLGVAAGVVPSGATQVRATRRARAARSVPTATAANTLSVRLSAQVRLIGRPGHVDNERGTFTGTFSGTIALRVEAVGSTGGTATFTMYPTKGGSISGHSVTRGHVNGATVDFTGTATITGGTGSWAHASGTGLRYEGVLNRQNNHATSVMSGRIRQ